MKKNTQKEFEKLKKNNKIKGFVSKCCKAGTTVSKIKGNDIAESQCRKCGKKLTNDQVIED